MSIELLMEIQKELEWDLEKSSSVESMITDCLEGFFLISGYCTVLSGVEIHMLSLDATSK
jgi:hypothetical protein